MIKEAVARRYAKGLFDVACEMNIVDEVANELDQVADLCRQEPGLKEVMEFRRVPTHVKKEIITSIMDGRISQVVIGFLEILIDKHRERSFEDIRKSYHDFYRQHMNIVVAEVRTAFPLASEYATRLQDVLQKATGKRIELEIRVQPELIGGLVVKIGDRVYDGSMTKHLEMMDARIIGSSSGKREVEM